MNFTQAKSVFDPGYYKEILTKFYSGYSYCIINRLQFTSNSKEIDYCKSIKCNQLFFFKEVYLLISNQLLFKNLNKSITLDIGV